MWDNEEINSFESSASPMSKASRGYRWLRRVIPQVAEHNKDGTFYSLKAILWIICIGALTLPLDPVMPSSGLDPSWVYAVATASSLEMQFGSQIIFTFGPFSEVYTSFYSSERWLLILSLSTLVTAVFWAKSWYMVKHLRIPQILILGLTVIVMISSRDAVFFILLLTIALKEILSYLLERKVSDENLREIPSRKETKRHSRIIEHIENYFSILTITLLLLVKISLLPLCMFVVIIMLAVRLYQRRYLSAGFLFLATPANLLLLWLLSGQKIASLTGYFTNSVEVIRTYSEAMSLEGSSKEIILFLLASIVLLIFVLRSLFVEGESRVVLLSAVPMLAVLFLGFKAGFTRHDGHAVIASQTLVGVVLLALAFISKMGLKRSSNFELVMILALTSWLVNDAQHVSLSTSAVKARIEKAILSPVKFPKLFFDSSDLETAFEASKERLTQELGDLPAGRSYDLFSYNTSLILSSELQWKPRPVFQSYQATSYKLLKMNADHFSGQSSPDSILFDLGPIDQRLPSLSDGASWLPILKNYERVGRFGSYINFERRDERDIVDFSVVDVVEMTSGGSGGRSYKIDIPAADIIVAEVEIEQSILEKFRSLVFKPSPIYIELVLTTGETRSYRFVPSMGRSGFILSPFVGNTNDFALLAEGGNGLSDVSSIRFSSGNDFDSFLSGEVSLKLTGLSRNGGSGPVPGLADSLDMECRGNFDLLELRVDSDEADQVLVRVAGWLWSSEVESLVPAEIVARIFSNDELLEVRRLSVVDRPDVAQHFDNDLLAQSGFEAAFSVPDWNALQSTHSLEVGYAVDEGYRWCQF